MRILRPLVAALALCLAVAPATAKRAYVDPTHKILADLHTAASCDDAKSPLRVWCIAADGWATGTAAPLPVGKVLVGIVISRPTAATGAWDLLADPTIGVAALTISKTGKIVKVQLTDVKPTSDAENLMAAQAIGALTVVFKGAGKQAALPKDLVAYLRTLKGKGEHPVAKDGASWTWRDGEAGVRKVGKFWVAVEATSTGDDGRFITILTDRWK